MNNLKLLNAIAVHPSPPKLITPKFYAFLIHQTKYAFQGFSLARFFGNGGSSIVKAKVWGNKTSQV